MNCSKPVQASSSTPLTGNRYQILLLTHNTTNFEQEIQHEVNFPYKNLHILDFEITLPHFLVNRTVS